MELTSDSVVRTVFPSAAFARDYQNLYSSKDNPNGTDVSWLQSPLNPKNRIDSLDPLQDAKWRIDGCASMGTQFYALPIFFHSINPNRIDIFIPESKKIPSEFHNVLDVHTATYLRDSCVASLGISRYVVRVLEHWTNQLQNLERFYNELPFGSRIVLENIAADIKDVRLQVVKTHFLERQLLSCESLQGMWEFTSPWPELVDISELHVLRQLHDSVSLVRLHDQRYIFKALTSHPKYLYHELKVLLTHPAHPSIISRPEHLVTKHCRFGGKVAVIGFTLPYHEKGTLRDILPYRRIQNSLCLPNQLKWAIQITEALKHIRDAGNFYCDLRLDNVVLDDSDAAVVIDFEARGVAFSASAPEINYLEYIYSIATADDEELYPSRLTEKYKQLWSRVVKGRSIRRAGESYRNPRHGYSVPWLCLDDREREAAEVYMLGRIFWCIFEGVGSPEKTALVQHLREDELEFPRWSRTPKNIRYLIERCTRFRKEDYKNLPIVRAGNLLIVRGAEEARDPAHVQRAARKWWQSELELAEAFLERRLSSDELAEQNPFGRPGLDEVLLELKTYERDHLIGYDDGL